MIIAELAWEYDGAFPIFEVLGPPGSFRIDFFVVVPKEIIPGSLSILVTPHELSEVTLLQFYVGTPAASAPKRGLFVLSFKDDSTIGLAFASTIDDRVVEFSFNDEHGFTERVLGIIFATCLDRKPPGK